MKLLRWLHAALPTTLVAAIVLPTLPGDSLGAVPGVVARGLLYFSIKQSWAMYAPDPQRAHTYMDLEALYHDDTIAKLHESEDVELGWGTTWAWKKTRVDIWKYYANFRPTQRNDNRTWYLRSVCVREARTGHLPRKITMYEVKRAFTSPGRVAAGAPDLGAAERRLVTVAFCSTTPVKEMIEADRALNPGFYE